MRSETRRGVGISASSRSVLSDPGMVFELPETASPKSPNRLHFWRRRRTVIPAASPTSEHPPTDSAIVLQPPSPVANDPNGNIVFLNNNTEFDLRSLFFRRRKASSIPDSLNGSAVSYRSSTSSQRSYNHGFESLEANKINRTETADPAIEVSNAKPALVKPRRRLRAKEELCIVLPKSTSRSRSQKSWFMGPGMIGREHAEGTTITTKDPSMDAVHAEMSVAGDNYFVRDANSIMGTFLCLGTRYRHYPQRDGFRLQQGDVFRIGPATSIRVVELRTTTGSPTVYSPRDGALGSLKFDYPKQNMAQTHKLERTPSTSSGNEFSPRMIQRLSTVEELRLVAADIEDDTRDDADGSHTRKRGSHHEKSNVVDLGDISKPRCVHFADTPPMMSDGSMFLGSRYVRQEIKELNCHEASEMEDEDDDVIKQLVGGETNSTSHATSTGKDQCRCPDFIRLVIFQHDPKNVSAEPREAREVILPGQKAYLIGSSPACDVRIYPSEGIDVRDVHARIVFDGTSFVLQDLSFERDLRRQTRVLLNQRAARVVRGDWLLLGKCGLHVTTTARAFGSERRPDIKDAAMLIDILRLSKRQPRTRDIFLPVGFRLHSKSGAGASSGSTGWGGSSGGPVTFGKGRDCDAQIFTAALAVEQFCVQLEHGACLLTPKPAGINSGTYFLIGRDDPGQSILDVAAGSKPDSEHGEALDIVKQTSKPLLLSETCIFRCGGCELEVIYVKTKTSSLDTKNAAATEEQEHIQLLGTMPWLQQIACDRKLIDNLGRCGQRLQLNTGDVIYEKGDSANFLFIVISGEVGLLYVNSNDDHDHDTDGMLTLTERVIAGGFFGEASLQDPLEKCSSLDADLEYTENATAATSCELLAISKEDVCGYLEIYMDVVRAHLRYDKFRDKRIRAACNHVPWLRGISLYELRTVSRNAEIAHYRQGSVLFEDGKLFIPPAFSSGSMLQLRDGILVLSRGKVRVIRSKTAKQNRKISKRNTSKESNEGEPSLDGVLDVDDEIDEEVEEWWEPHDPVVVMGSSFSPAIFGTCDQSFRLEAYSTVECFFIAAPHVAHLAVGADAKDEFLPIDNDQPKHHPPPMTRGNSLVARRMHHSQVVTSTLHNSESNPDGIDDNEHHPLDGYDGEGDTTGDRRWRRKKRNKQLLEQTVLETQNDTQISNALVLYVLAGAQRGDIHVVRNVATIGGLLSGADIEINDRYVSRSHAIIEYHDNKYWLYDNGSKWGTFVRLEEDNTVDINPGDVFLAGEVEFTCLGSYPDRNKSSICCIM